MALAIGSKKIWDFWAPKYDKIWGFQRFSLRPTRRFVHRYLDSLSNFPERILDIGCGVGELSSEIARNSANTQITAVDYSAGMITRAKKDFQLPNIEYLHGSLELLQDRTGSFDLIISTHSFPYFPDKLKAARQLKSLLKKGGRVIIIQGNTNNFYDFLWLALVQLGVSKAQFLGVNKVKLILEEAEFSVAKVVPIERAFFIPSIYMVEGINTTTK